MRHVAFKSAGSHRRCAAPAKAGSSRARAAVVVCSLAREQVLGRRQLLGTGAVVLAAGTTPLLIPQPVVAGPLPQALVPVDQLGLLQKQAQLKDFRLRAEAAIKEVLGAADASACMRLVLHDAATYDAATKTGGLDGSIVLPEELSRPENAGLDVIVDKLAQAKAKIDAGGAEDGSGPISWADLIVLAAKVTTQAQWASIKRSRAQIASGGDVIAGPAFGAAWPVRLGRTDSTVPGPAGRIPSADASVGDIKSFMEKLGVAPGSNVGSGLFSAKPPFWERPTLVLWTAAAADPAAEEERFVAQDPAAFKGYKQNYDRSRKTVTRTDYEVDFIDYFTLLTNLGASFKKDAYLHPEAVVAVKF
ncbi:hypothetical protein VOLCADRAFT_105827 [Volvox carteri f. nagariensis]|uniref:Plant heme peroxidase family profile domain-containing protein n=1 Tax=Volvox carteri f. nagariensis TaxID=3068 RepID=D8U3E5_VOLCA|nr:uncharacterized protein VOLCADRAFT_105827 [Volvox carteri f. nagariensis]EFJ45738.1 hypothetical protein VOLCADRAFT_105827 [Volvox carteri f. nagariensis]|eukprot:XP_002953139.1 hypothetical protein VOLCADRAFT_105827 [Volvox carteri f. nagariensis]